MPSKGATEMAPDRLEAWYAAECDAEVGVTIAGAIAKQAEGLQDPGRCERQGWIPSSFTKTAVGTKKRVPSVCDLLAASRNKLGIIKTFEGAGLGACPRGANQAAAPYHVEFDRKASDAINTSARTSPAMRTQGGASLG